MPEHRRTGIWQPPIAPTCTELAASGGQTGVRNVAELVQHDAVDMFTAPPENSFLVGTPGLRVTQVSAGR